MSANELQSNWDASYRRSENFLFYPHEEVIRFFSRRIRRRTGPDSFVDIHRQADNGRLLDLGCGIGRHVVYSLQMEVDAYGIDHSEVAIDSACQWLRRAGYADADDHFVSGDVTALPWANGHFAFAVSHGVLDSMPFEVACAGVHEVHRVMQPHGLFYFDLMSGDETGRSADFAEEILVDKDHEKGTIQSYFNQKKLEDMVANVFNILECVIIRRTDTTTGKHASRWHVVAERK